MGSCNTENLNTFLCKFAQEILELFVREGAVRIRNKVGWANLEVSLLSAYTRVTFIFLFNQSVFRFGKKKAFL